MDDERRDRWRFRGGLSERELPREDAMIDALTHAERAAVGAAWSTRARAELGAAVVFAMVARTVLETPGPAALHWLAARAPSDELRHAAICRQVAARYLGRDAPWPEPPPSVEPRFDDLPDETCRDLQVIVSCCVSETVANAFLLASRARAEAPLVRAALRELLRDEVDHARVGWSFLAVPQVRARLLGPLARALPALLEAVRVGWRERAREYPERPPPGHGLLAPSETYDVVERCLDETVIPGFAHLGVDVSGAQRWRAQRRSR